MTISAILGAGEQGNIDALDFFFFNFQTLWDTKAFYTFHFSKPPKRFRSQLRDDLEFSLEVVAN